MKRTTTTLEATTATLIALLLSIAPPVGADVLFDSDTPLTMELKGPFRTIERAEDKDVEWPGTLHIDDTVFDVEYSLRGNNRLMNCRYPPLRVDFDNDQIDDTLFDKQKDIKLVVQCNKGSNFVDFLRTEYLVYQAMLTLTPMAYRARWVDVTYFDTEREQTREAPAFFVERKSRVAKRQGLDTTDVPSVRPRALDHAQSAMATLFAWLIGNVDYSIVTSPPGDDECCHNAKVLVDADENYYPILYDFDNTGIVDTNYSVPRPDLGIYSVTQRLYRGICIHNDEVRNVRAQMIANSDELLALFENDPVLSSRQKRKVRKFLEDGFETLRDDGAFEEEVIGNCRG